MEDLSLNLTGTDEHTIIGKVAAIYFSDPATFYKVILIEIEETSLEFPEDRIVVTGNLGKIQEESTYKFHGEFMNHQKYGLQFKANRYETAQPSSSDSVVAYLSGDQFKGVGAKTAEKIVDELGIDCIDRIVEDPRVLDQVPGVSKKQKEVLIEVLSAEYGMQKVILTLNKFGIDNTLAFKIYGYYAEETMEIIRENPYQLIQDIERIGFARADMIADNLDFEPDAPERIQAGILYALFTISSNTGDTYATETQLISEATRELEKSRPFIIEEPLVHENLSLLLENGLVYEDAGRYFQAPLYHAEWGIVHSLERITKSNKNEPIKDKKFKKIVADLEDELDMEYGDSQKDAIKQALEASIFILTGGPGTGKTTVLDGIVKLFAELNDLSLDPHSYKGEPFPILLAAPTGRAAKRMQESTGLPASTIHRLLGLTADDDDLMSDNGFQLEGELLIIDEMSMVDTYLANQLFRAIPSGMKVILVGDQDQLPSVGPGQVFRDIIDSGTIPMKELIEIYRQGDDSSIIPLAHEIKHNRLPADFLDKKKDRNFFPARRNDAVPVIEKIVSKAIERGFTAEDIQILAPIYKGPAGINVLNERLQDIFNPNPDGSRTEMKHIDTIYRIGDKVLQLQNDPENNVFNGDIGMISSITKAKYTELKSDIITIDFEGIEVSYMRSAWGKITLAYCTSIHKAQGSEYDIVILPMLGSYGRMLKKDILYTAITRASKSLLLIGEPDAFVRSIQSLQNLRNTALKERLQTPVNEFTVEQVVDDVEVEDVEEVEEVAANKGPFILTPELVKSFVVDPMIGMENIKP